MEELDGGSSVKGLPERVEVLILGGGIHGAGLLHDLASRGLKQVCLVEKGSLGVGTSSKSTKLVHGGLRYLQNIRDFGLVAEALRERQLLSSLVPELVQPIELIFPILRGAGMPGWKVRAGLTLYDVLAGKKHRIAKHKAVNEAEAMAKVPPLAAKNFSKYYSFWDAQTDDLALVRTVAHSAAALGAQVCTQVTALGLEKCQDGYRCTLADRHDRRYTVQARAVVNCLGPWAHVWLERSGFVPKVDALNNKGVHLVLPDLGLKSGLFLQSPEDGRIFFMLPWQGSTLLGTTEESYAGDPGQVVVQEEDVDYLLAKVNRYIKSPLKPQDVEFAFAGLRWLAAGGDNISKVSRSFTLTEHSEDQQRSLLTLYGGKLTTYRSTCEVMANRLVARFAEHWSPSSGSKTASSSAWQKLPETQQGGFTLKDRFGAEALPSSEEGFS